MIVVFSARAKSLTIIMLEIRIVVHAKVLLTSYLTSLYGIAMSKNAELRKEAKEIAETKVAFYIHFVVYIIINIFLMSIWYFTGKGFPWFIFPLVGWGIAVLIHFLFTFVFSGRKFLDRMAEKEYEKLKKS